MGPLREAKSSKYLHILFASLVVYGFSAISGKYALSFATPITVLFLTQFFVALVFLGYITIFYDGISDVKDGFSRAGWLILLVAVLTVSYRVLQYFAMSLQYVSLSSP
ncbi:MAG: hypothetical protein ACLFTQ_04235 [Candidatus Aenigmatarchaeota archaeon]